MVQADEPNVVVMILRHLPFHYPLVFFASSKEAPIFDIDAVVWKIEVWMREGPLE